MYSIINPISKGTTKTPIQSEAVQKSVSLIKSMYEKKHGTIHEVLLNHYTGSKILFDKDRLHSILEQHIQSHENDVYDSSLLVYFIDCFYKQRNNIDSILRSFNLDFSPVLTEEINLPGESLAYAYIYMHKEQPIIIIRDSYKGIYNKEGFGKRPQFGLEKTEENGEYIPLLIDQTFRSNFAPIVKEMQRVFPQVQWLDITHTNGGRGGVSCKLALNSIRSFPHSIDPNQTLSTIIAKHKLSRDLTPNDQMSARKDGYSIAYHTFASYSRGFNEVILTSRDDWVRKYATYKKLMTLRNTKYADEAYGDIERDYGFSKIDLFNRLISKNKVRVKNRNTGEVKYELSVQNPIIAMGTAKMRSKKIKRIIQGTYGTGQRSEVNEKLYYAIEDSLSPFYKSSNLIEELQESLRTDENVLHDLGFGMQVYCLQNFMDVDGSAGDDLYENVSKIVKVPLELWGFGSMTMQVTPFKLGNIDENTFIIMTRLFLRPIKFIRHLIEDIGKFYNKINHTMPAQRELSEVRRAAKRYEDPDFLNEIGETSAAKKANGYIPGYYRVLDFLFKALGVYWGSKGRFKDENIEIEGI